MRAALLAMLVATLFSTPLSTSIVLVATAAAAQPGSAANGALFEHPVTAGQLLQTTLAGPAAELSKAKVLSGKFVQRRFLKGLERPLASSGDFVLAREQGIIWRTATPFPSEFVLSDKGMSLLDGDTETRLSAASHPGLQAALKMFFALITLDMERLTGSFDLYGDNQGDRWQVGLRPRDGGLAQVFDRAVISGAQTVERIELSTAGGDRTEIEFSGVATRAELDASDAARFRE
ncbi:MAG TPA: outer membrane lipoprotein carrier protein LolA [Steroidobacteraceae bacterium]|nr:outer membrane lipoprotein carrier protein LolA [Steroidobacteraceae bacterium]